jgi:hypothetical protein
MYFEIESDREVSVAGIGILMAGEPHRVSEDEMRQFEIHNHTPLIKANFAHYVKVTAVVESEKNEEVNN